MAKEKFYSLWGKATDKNGQDHYVTVVGKFTQSKVTETIPTSMTVIDERRKQHEGLLITDYKKKVRSFTMAKAICDPRDTFSFEEGQRIAKKRIEEGEVIGTQTSEDITMLNDDQCQLLVFGEVNHIIQHIDEYIS